MRPALTPRPLAYRALGVTAAAALLISFALPYAFHPAGAAGRDCREALRGLFAGISIGMNLLLVRRRCGARKTLVRL